MKTFSIRAAFKRGWELFMAHKATLLGATLIILVLGSFKSGGVPHSVYGVHFSYGFGLMGSSSIILSLALAVASAIVYIGWIKLCLKLLDGEAVTIKELFMHTGLFFKYVGAVILFALMFLPVGLILGIVAASSIFSGSGTAILIVAVIIAVILAMYLAITFGFGVVIAIDEHLSIWDSFAKSAEITKGSKWHLVLMALAMVIVNIAGAIVLVVGLLVSIPVSTLAFLSVYRRLLEHHRAA